MKTKLKNEMDDELRPHYDLAGLLKKGVQGQYAGRYLKGTNLVLLEQDVVEAFPTEASVNEALRLVIKLRQLPGIDAADHSHH